MNKQSRAKERLFEKAGSGTSRRVLWLSCVLQFYAIVSTGLRGKCPTCANHTAVGNLCAFGAVQICAWKQLRNTCFPELFVLHLTTLWMEAMLNGFPLNVVLRGKKKPDEKHEKSVFVCCLPVSCA